ncbi:MAG TPA: glycerol kinase GlpK [Baekduia sp.]|uniref:glycerol kinase GlpK n=1 Tax=Baekduia sp. TaxID=2600305 RepID=UPI002D7810D8|nr:glycerol kinase GlpK [Baekduia sp.]HET6509626.1 glycerol kinase GlpK [Baekduia sp.]
MILGIDQGTTGSRAFIFDEKGKVVTSAYSEFEQFFPRPGWVEHDAAEIWEVTKKVCHEALDEAGLDGSKLKAIGITNQRETAVAWDRDSGEPLHRAIVWQDRRTAGRCDRLKAEGYESMFRERTGLVLDAYFSGTKYEWMIKEGGVSPDAAFGTIDSWLLFKFTGRHATDYSNASRTLLFNIRELAWDGELCDTLGVPIGSLPEPVPNAQVLGETTEFGGKVPVAAMVGDQQGALYGQACLEPGLSKNTYGTGNFLLANAGDGPPVLEQGLITTVAWGIGGRVDYAMESSMFVTGAGVQWLRDGLKIIDQAADTEQMAASLDSNEGVYFVPALTGLGSPHWDPYARGTIVGLTRGSGRAHIARAALEAIAYQSVDAVRAQNTALGVRLKELRADGGATANGWLMQFQADMLGVPVVVPEIADTTVLGAAYLAGVATDLWTEDDVRSLWTESKRYEPKMGDDQRQSLLSDWRRALQRSGRWVIPD